MADNTIATAYVQLTASADGMTDSISKAIGGSAEKEGVNFGALFAKSAAGAIAVGATSVASAAAGLWKTASDTALAGDEIAKSSEKLGVTVEQYQALAFAAEHCGFEVSSLISAQNKLLNSDFDGNIYDAVNAVMELGTEEERTALATDLFGARATTAMADLLKGNQSLDEFKTQLEGLGGVMSDAAVKSSVQFQDALTDVNTAIDGMTQNLSAKILPGITTVMNGISGLISGNDGAGDMISSGINNIVLVIEKLLPKINSLISSLAPALISGGSNLILALADGIISAIPVMLPTLVDVIGNVAEKLLDLVPKILDVGAQVIIALVEGMAEIAPTIIPKAVSTIMELIKVFFNDASLLLDAALNLVDGLKEGIIAAIPVLMQALPEVLASIIGFFENGVATIIEVVAMVVQLVAEALPSLMNEFMKVLPDIIYKIGEAIVSCAPEVGVAFVELFLVLLTVLPQIISSILSVMPEVVSAVVVGFKDGAPEFEQAAKDSFKVLLDGFVNSKTLQDLKDKCLEIVDNFKNNFGEQFEEFKNIGSNVIKGLIEGIQSMAGKVGDTVKDVASNVSEGFKNFFRIGSPSKLFKEYGKFLDEGLAIGIIDSQDVVSDAMDGLNTSITSDITTTTSVAENSSLSSSIASGTASDNSLYQLLAKYLPIIAEGNEGNGTIEANAEGLFNMIRSRNNQFKKANGKSAFA